MSCIRSTSSSRSTNDTRAHYKITRTVTDVNGKTRTETVEMADADAIKVSLFRQTISVFLFCLLFLADGRFSFESERENLDCFSAFLHSETIYGRTR